VSDNILLDLDAIEAAAKAAGQQAPSAWFTRKEEALLAAMLTPSVVLELVQHLRAAVAAADAVKIPSFYWAEGDEGTWNSIEEWAQDYFDNNGEGPCSTSLSRAVELAPIEVSRFVFDDNGICTGFEQS
jgi:hypothetical protein